MTLSVSSTSSAALPPSASLAGGAGANAGLGQTANAISQITPLPDGVPNGDLKAIGTGAKQVGDVLGVTDMASQLLKNKLNITG
jgi:hypothetical protein